MDNFCIYSCKTVIMLFKYFFIICLVTSQNAASESEGPVFIPNVWIGMTSSDKIGVYWKSPPPELRYDVDYFQLLMMKDDFTDEERNYVPSNFDVDNFNFTFGGLKGDTPYDFQVAACNVDVGKCGNWSEIISARTLEGIPSMPTEFTVNCTYSNETKETDICTRWFDPINPNGKIQYYEVTIEGNGSFINENNTNNEFSNTWNLTTTSFSDTFPYYASFVVPRNANYTITLRAVTVAGMKGEWSRRKCIRLPEVPKKPQTIESDNIMSYIPRLDLLYKLVSRSVNRILKPYISIDPEILKPDVEILNRVAKAIKKI